MAVSSTRQELLPSLCIVEHQQLQALHKEFCQQLVGTRYLGQYANAAIHNRCMTYHTMPEGRENLISSLVTVHMTLLSSSILQATSSSFNVLAELEAIRHKRDEAAQQNEAPVAGSVEGQSVPVKIETLIMVARKDRELFGADYAANAVFEIGTDWPSTDPATGASFCCAASSLFGLCCFGILTQLSDANQLLTKLLVKSLQLLVLLYTQAWEQLLTESPSAGTIDSEQWQTQSILMTPLQDSQQLKLAKWKFQLLGILQWGH
ncbi:hypothetical protein EMCRGX_G003417 [Ephydatia muelleri]